MVESKQGKSVCVSFHTAFEGVCLETYYMEVDLTRKVQISRHNIPPCIPLEKLAKENLQTDFKGFLQTLSLHLNALAGRKQQISLIEVQKIIPLCAAICMSVCKEKIIHVDVNKIMSLITLLKFD